MNENKKNNNIINILFVEENPILDTNLNNTNTAQSNTWPSEDSDQYNFLIHDMFLDHFFP